MSDAIRTETARAANVDSVRVEFAVKKFKLDAISFEEGNPSFNPTGFFVGNKEYVEDIKKGFLYYFFKRLRRDNRQTITEILWDYEEIVEGALVSVPQITGGRINDIYYAYSEILLTNDRIETIRQEILDRYLYISTTPPRRAVRIQTRMFLPEKYRGNESFASSLGATDYLDVDKREIYLYDWNGYLCDCAQYYNDTVSSNYDKYQEYIGTHINLGDEDTEESGLMRSDLYTLADTVDTLVQEDRGRANVLRTQDYDFFTFYSKTTNEIDYLRSGGQVELFKKTIQLMILLLSDPRANSTLTDYMFGENGESWKAIALINKCLYRYHEMFNKHEKRRLFRIWENMPVSLTGRSNLNNLIEHLQRNNRGGRNLPITAREVHGHIGETSVFLYIAAATWIEVAEEPAEIPPDLDGILDISLSVNLTNRRRLISNNLLAEGILRNRSKMEDAVTFTGRRPQLPFRRASDVVVTTVDIIDDQQIIQMRKITVNTASRLGMVLEFHSLLSELALAEQSRSFASAAPHFISVVGSAGSIAAAIRGASLATGVLVQSVFSLVRVTINMVRAGRMSDPNVSLAFAVSGAFYAGAAVMTAIPKIVTCFSYKRP